MARLLLLFVSLGLCTPLARAWVVPPGLTDAQERELDSRQEAARLLQLGRASLHLGDARSAVTQLERAVQLAEEGEGDALLASACTELGLAHTMAGQLRLAQDELERAVALARDLQDTDLLSGCLGNLGTLHSDLGEFDRAIQFCSAALDFFGEDDRSLLRARLLNRIGCIYSSAGQPERALEFFDHAYELMDGIDPSGCCGLLINMASCVDRLGDLEQALSLYAEAIAVAEKLGDVAHLNLAHMNSGITLARLGDAAGAVQALEPVAAWLRQHGRQHDLAIALIALGISLERVGRDEEGIAVLQEARQLTRESGAKDIDLGALSALAAMYASFGEYEHAFEHSEEILSLMQDQALVNQESSLEEFEVRYKDQEKRRRIQDLESAARIAELELTKSRQQRNSLLLLSALALVSTVGLSWLARSRRQAHRALLETTQYLASHRDQLQKALGEVATLRGLLPVCAHCSSICDDAGEWHAMETYIGHRTGATFSHGICPPCLEGIYDEDLAGHDAST